MTQEQELFELRVPLLGKDDGVDFSYAQITKESETRRGDPAHAVFSLYESRKEVLRISLALVCRVGSIFSNSVHWNVTNRQHKQITGRSLLCQKRFARKGRESVNFSGAKKSFWSSIKTRHCCGE